MATTKLTITQSEIRLPVDPRDQDYEDYVAAYLLSAGYHVERRLIHHDYGTDILELDIVATDSRHGQKRLFEIKGGGWGITDLHKMGGWRKYIDIPSALIYRKDPSSGLHAAEHVAADHNISLVEDHAGNLSRLRALHPHLINVSNEWTIPFFRISLFVVGTLEAAVARYRKENNGVNAAETLSRYMREVRNYAFFESTPANRALRLIRAYNDSRNLTSRMAHIGADGTLPDDTTLQIPVDRFQSLTYTCNKEDILYSSQFAELACRLALLKCVVDHISQPAKTGGWIEHLPEQLLNIHLNGCVDALRSHLHASQYPHFWQTFVYLFGGILDEDHLDEEYRLLTQLTGIPEKEIPNALSAFDLLFPTPGGWFTTNRSSHIRHLMHMPVPLKGIGSYMRYNHFTGSNEANFQARYNHFAFSDMQRYLKLTNTYIRTQAQTAP